LTDDEYEYLKKDLTDMVKHSKLGPDFVDFIVMNKHLEERAAKCDCAYCKYTQRNAILVKKYLAIYKTLEKKLGKASEKGTIRLGLKPEEHKLLKMHVKHHYMPSEPSMGKRVVASIVNCTCPVCKRFKKTQGKNTKCWENAKALLEKLKK